MSVTRRQFLQIFGLSAGGVLLNGSGLSALVPAPPPATIQGRTLRSTALYPSTSGAAAPLRRLWPGDVLTLQDAGAGWYRTAEGVVPRADVQPINAAVGEPLAAVPPVYGGVRAPQTAVLAYCDAGAPLVAHIGHGGVVQMVDHLTDDDGAVWYQAARSDGTPLGWTQGAHWSPLAHDSARHAKRRRVAIDRRRGHLTAYEDDTAVMRFAVNVPAALTAGAYALNRGSPGGGVHQAYEGVPYLLRLTGPVDVTAHGVYWHNDFSRTLPDNRLEMPVIGAGWLYAWVTDDIPVRAT